MARRPDGPPPPPTVQRLWVRYAKRGRLRFSSHRDFQRALERAVRRAGVPIAFSAGFSPHPKISFANAAPTGMGSEAEYLELGLARAVDPDQVRSALDSALPPDLDVLTVVAAPDREAGGPTLAERLEASVWRITLAGVPPTMARSALEAFLAAPEVLVERMTKNGRRVFDARAAVVAAAPSTDSLAGGGLDPCAILDVVVRHTTPAVRPDDVLTGLHRVADLAPPSPPLVIRLAQGPLTNSGGWVADPLAFAQDLAAVRTSAGARSPDR